MIVPSIWKRGDLALATSNTAGIDGIKNDVVEITQDESASTGPFCYIHTGLLARQSWWFNNQDLILLYNENNLDSKI